VIGSYEVRDACREDLPGLLAIYNDVVLTSTAIYTEVPESLEQREAWWQQRTGQGYPVLIARDGSSVLGFASFGDFRAWPGYRFTVEHSVHVRSDQRRRVKMKRMKVFSCYMRFSLLNFPLWNCILDIYNF